MAKGFISGVFWGAVLSGAGLTVASQMSGRVQPAPPEPAAVEVPSDSEFSRARSEVEPVLPEPEAPPPAERPPERPETGEAAEPPRPDTEPAGTPEAGEVESGGMEAPAMGEAPPELETGAEEPVETGRAAAPPLPPETDPAPSAETPVPAESPPAEAEPAAPPVAEEAATPPDVPAPAAEGAPPAAPEAPAAEQQPEVPGPPVGDAMPGVEVADSVEGMRLPAPEFEDAAPGPAASGTTAATPGPALERNAETFAWDGSAPLVAVILFRDADSPPPARLAGFPVPLTVAIDPTADGAAEAMGAYRDAGVEVVALAPLPEGATPADVEVAFQGYLDTLPGSVAVLDTPDAAFQQSRPRAAQVAEILAETGHGLITYESGLNSALQLAAQEGVAAETVLRAFDDGERDVAAMKRFLDQAAFQAGVEGSAIITGELREPTLAALAEWVLGNRAATVTMAPVSGILTSLP